MKTPEQIAAAIDHTLLRPEATPEQVDLLCDQAIRYGFAGVCVNPVYVRRVAERLSTQEPASRPAIVSVAGFPLGASLGITKEEEAERCLEDGASEIDMVIHVGALAAGDLKSVRAEIERVARVVHGGRRKILKVILETTALAQDQIVAGCRCCAEGEADYVKSSTGFHPGGGATVEHIRLLHRHAAPMKVKASGGIRSAAQAAAMLQAGATRIGTSSGVAIIEELRNARAG